jgi:hypothetical protein
LTTTSWPAGSTGWTYLANGDSRSVTTLTCPANGLYIAAGTSIQGAVNANPPGTTFCLPAGTWHESVTAQSGDTFIGAGIPSRPRR